jgi:DNA-binding transcriptional ArsR family regulator
MIFAGQQKSNPAHGYSLVSIAHSPTLRRSEDATFKALADPTRRSLLDELLRHSGQTLSSLEEPFAMTRFGVMKHLKLLEESGLVVTSRQGRQTLHHLNVVPIRLVHDRWISKFVTLPPVASSGGSGQ